MQFSEDVYKRQTGNSLVVSGQEYTRYDMKLTAAEDCHEAQLTISCKEGGEILLGFISVSYTHLLISWKILFTMSCLSEVIMWMLVL